MKKLLFVFFFINLLHYSLCFSQGIAPSFDCEEPFKIEHIDDGKAIEIFPLNHTEFELPDSSWEISVFQIMDFNADQKSDLMLNMGACGTGGCIYNIFLQAEENTYCLALSSYLKNTEFIEVEDASINILSSETVRPYDPSEIQYYLYRFIPSEQEYNLDTTYRILDKP